MFKCMICWRRDPAPAFFLGEINDFVKEKKAVVFQLATGNVVDQPVDLFIQEPFGFEEEYAKATLIEYAPGVIIPVVSLAALIAMKVTAGRPRDLLDIDELKKMAE